MHLKKSTLFVAILTFAIAVGATLLFQKAWNWYYTKKHTGEPENLNVKIDSTNLPIVFIDTDGTMVDQDEYITARMKIVYNESRLNYGDTIAHPNQRIDYDGYIGLKYRGNTSYTYSPKKPYAIRALDKPLNKKGKKKSVKFLGMRKGKKWALIGGLIDKSLIRDALTYELARPYFEYVPDMRYCEVIKDGVYIGLYCLFEQIDGRRLPLKKPKKDDNKLVGGYLLQVDARKKSGSIPSKHWSNVAYDIMYPDSNKLSTNQKQYIGNIISNLENGFLSQNSPFMIDTLSLIDYQLFSEFTNNVDAYTLSTFMYMKEKEGRKESYLKFTLWDFNLAYGNCNYNDHWRTDVWVYPSKDIKGESPFWITLMMQKPEYVTMLKNRWKQMRQENLSEEHIFLVIDSLCQNLSSHNALLRDSTAWKSQWQDGCMITHYWPQKYVSTTYIDEINHLKCWIKERLYWMDEQLLNN